MPLSSVLGASSVIKPGVCTSTTRPSVPYEGQLIYETDTDRVAAWNGSAWVYETAVGGPPGLVYLTGATFTTVTSVSLPNSTFTSTYRNYRIVLQISNVANTTASTIRLRASGADNTTSNYRSVIIGLSDSNVTNNSTSQGTSSWLGIGANTSTAAAMTVDVMAPQVTQQTQLFGVIAYSNAGYGHIGGLLSGNFIATTSFDALSFIFAGNTDGNYRVYGYADS